MQMDDIAVPAHRPQLVEKAEGYRHGEIHTKAGRPVNLYTIDGIHLPLSLLPADKHLHIGALIQTFRDLLHQALHASGGRIIHLIHLQNTKLLLICAILRLRRNFRHPIFFIRIITSHNINLWMQRHPAEFLLLSPR